MNKDQMDELESLEILHKAIGNTIAEKQGNDIPPERRMRHPVASKGYGSGDKSFRGNRDGVKVHHGEHGEVFELKAGTKLADVLPGDRKKDHDVSLDRWLAATMLGDRCEDKGALEYASEVKSVSGGTTGIVVPETFQGEWIDNMRSFMVLERAGMTTATMLNRTVSASRVVSDPPVAWRAEGGALNPGAPTFELANLVAKSVACRVQSTAELAQDSAGFGSQLLTLMTKALALEVDRVGMFGTGAAGQPTGIVNTAGIGTIAAVGTPAGYSPFVNGLQQLMEANVPLELAQKAAIMSPRTWGTLENLVDTLGQPIERPHSLENMTFLPTTSVPNNLGAGNDESQIIMGDFTDLVLGVRMEASVEALRLQSYADNLLLEFVGWTRVDFLVRRPASFLKLDGVTAA